MRKLGVLFALIVTTGCGDGDRPKLVTVTGKVSMAGKPLTAGSINLYPDASNSFTKDNPSSLLQVDGSFLVKTFPFGDGVPPGKYKVTLSPELATRIKQPKYGKADQTPWSLEVPDSGIKDIKLEVK